MDSVRDRVGIEQVPELRELLERAMCAFTTKSRGGAVENLAPTAKRRKRQEQPAFRVCRIAPFQRELDRDEVTPRECRKHLLTRRCVEPC